MTNLKVYTNETTTTVREEVSVDDLKLREFERADRDIRNFIAGNDTLMQSFFDLIDAYNTAVLDVKNDIRNKPGDNSANVGPFKRGKRPHAAKYGAKKMGGEALETLAHHGGLKVDTKILESLVLRGDIAPELVADAKTIEPGSFRVTGPKTIEFNL
jgi:hypothetical protein